MKTLMFLVLLCVETLLVVGLVAVLLSGCGHAYDPQIKAAQGEVSDASKEGVLLQGYELQPLASSVGDAERGRVYLRF